MSVTTLNMTTLDGGVIIKKGGGGGATINNQDKVVDITENGTTEVVADGGYTGLGKVTINTEVSGGGGADLEGEYFLAKPNGRYWKFSFSPPPSNQYVDPNSLSTEQLEALLRFCEQFEPLSVVYGAAVCNAGVPLNAQLRVDGVAGVTARICRMSAMLNSTDIGIYEFNSCFLSVWKECSVKTSTVTENVPFHEYDLVSLIKQLASMNGAEITDEQVMMMFESQFMLIPATEEEYKAARREN
jgi:hypothetical protein